MEVPLDGTHRPSQCLGQGLHLGPAQTTLVVGVICEGAVGRDRLGGDSVVDEGLDLRDTRKLGLLRHQPPPISGAAVRSGVIECPKAAGPSVKRNSPRRFFYALFTGAYFTYTGILALAPNRRPTMPTTINLSVPYDEPLPCGPQATQNAADWSVVAFVK